MSTSQYKIDFRMSEKNNPFNKERAKLILDLIFNNPFGGFKEMFITYKDNDESEYDLVPFDESIVSDSVLNSSQCSIVLSSGGKYHDARLYVSFLKRNDFNSFSIVIDKEDFLEQDGLRKVEKYIRNIAPVFTRLDNASCSTTKVNFIELWNKLKLDFPLLCFPDFICWINITGPAAFEHPYQNVYKQEDILKAPVYQLEKWDNGFIFMKAYENPFEYNTPENIERVVKLTNYLWEKAHIEQW
jgi:hypothetical protein